MRPLEIQRRWGAIDPAVAAIIEDTCRGERPWPLVFIGRVGSGKSCAALALMDRVYASRTYRTVEQLAFDSIEAANGRRFDSMGRTITAVELREQWSGAAIACLDELGSRDKVTDYQFELVKRCIDDRHGKPTIFVSNKNLKEMVGIYDARISSRLAAGTVIEFAGIDRRVMK